MARALLVLALISAVLVGLFVVDLLSPGSEEVPSTGRSEDPVLVGPGAADASVGRPPDTDPVADVEDATNPDRSEGTASGDGSAEAPAGDREEVTTSVGRYTKASAGDPAETAASRDGSEAVLPRSTRERTAVASGRDGKSSSSDLEDRMRASKAARARQRRIQAAVIPPLLEVLELEKPLHPEIESAAYIALAKVARSSAHVEIIMRGLNDASARDPAVLDGAALGLGLLRRTNPADRFSAAVLGSVRALLFRVFEDGAYPVQTRGFAAVAIGLLGDQPRSSGGGRSTTRHLFKLLATHHGELDPCVGLLMAVGMQPHLSVTKEQRGVLTVAALEGRLYEASVNGLIRAYAAHALGRIGTGEDIDTLAAVLTARRGMPKNVKRSAAIGLGLLSRHVERSDRERIAAVLLTQYDRLKDTSTKNFALISLAYLLVDDVRSGSTHVLVHTQADERILEIAEGGSYRHRPFGAMALGLILREVGNANAGGRYLGFRESAFRILRGGVTDIRQGKKCRAAFCTAVGMARDEDSMLALRAIVADRNNDATLRGYAGLGLGLMGNATPEVVTSITEGMCERSSEKLRRQMALALGLLGNPVLEGTDKTAVDFLVDELEQAKTQSLKRQVVLALASIGGHRAVAPLVEILQNEDEQDLTRALACAGLGMVGDIEPVPSVERAVQDLNYRASTDLINALRSIL